MKEYHVDSSEQLFELLHDFKESWSWVFRGQSSAEWKLKPKAGRPEFQKHYNGKLNPQQVLKSWKRYAVHFLDDWPNDEDDWDWLTLAQHHGLVTPLLDWTKNPLNAAFFAVRANNDSDDDVAIYAFQNRYGDESDAASPFDVEGFKVYWPKGLSARVVNQRGLFTISVPSTLDVEGELGNRLHKITIAASATDSIARILGFFGVNKISIYQDLDRLSEHLNDFVKEVGDGTPASVDVEAALDDDLERAVGTGAKGDEEDPFG